MSDDNLTAFLEALQGAYREVQIKEISKFFSLPLVIYSAAGVAVIRDEVQLLSMTEQYRAAISALEVTSTLFQVEHRDLPVNRRLRATVRFTDFAEDGQPVTGSLIRYFLVEKDGSYKIEMLEYLEMPLPIEEVVRIVH